MRVISQDGTIDTPYDLSMIWIREQYGYLVMANLPNDEPVILGKYSSRGKALKAMEMLRESYREYIATITTTQGVAQVLMFVDNNESNLKLSANIVNGIKENIYFQFPKDDEVEV